MKVNIQHSVELEEVPLKVGELYDKCTEQLKTLGQIAGTLNILEPKNFISKVDFLRQNLFSLDDSLSECVDLMAGYIGATEQIEEQTTETKEPAPNVEEILESLPKAEDFKTNAEIPDLSALDFSKFEKADGS